MKVDNKIKLIMHDIEMNDISNIVMPLISGLPLDLTFSGRSEDVNHDVPVDISIDYVNKDLTEVYFMPRDHRGHSVVYSGFNNLGPEYTVSFENDHIVVSKECDDLGKLETKLYNDYHLLR